MRRIIRCLMLALSCAGLLIPLSGEAQGLPPDYTANLLDSFSFNDTTNWTDDYNDWPLSRTNLTAVQGDGPAVLMDSTNASWLQFPLLVSGPWTNLSFAQGTIEFWCFPTNSASTNGWCVDAGQRGTFFEVGTSNGTWGWWALYTDGSNVLFSSQDTNGVLSNYFSTPITWSSGTNGWQFLALTYDTNATQLFLNGTLIASGPPMGPVPDTNVFNSGMFIGSSGASNQVHAAFDDIWTYDAPIDASTIAGDYAVYGIVYGNLPPPGPLIQPDLTGATNTPPSPPTLDAITGQGFLTYAGSPGSCFTTSSFWMTNVTAKGTNGTMALTFTIMGGPVSGTTFDVFGTAALVGNSLTNAQFVWLGQGTSCSTWTIAPLTNSAVFLVLGSLQDSDYDGLTDAYEALVSHTNPHSASSANDGISDLYKVLHGIQPWAPVSIPSLASTTIQICPVQ